MLAAAAPLPAAEPPAPSWRVTHAEVAGSLSGSVKAQTPEEGAQLAALTARLFMWDLDMRRDVERGDRLAIAYGRDAAGELVIGAARYTSGRRGATFEAFRFQVPGDPFPSYWDREGREVPRRLAQGPLRSYDQITSLLKDRPTHRGMDFKTPVGTPVQAHHAGRVTRANWRRGPNGQCLEIAYADGVKARYLHLSSVNVRPGAEVRRGQVVALTGNTGRSTAPHLHYEIERGGRILDPVVHHGTTRRTLPPKARPAFTAIVARLGPLLEAAPAAAPR